MTDALIRTFVPPGMRFALRVALRYLRAGGGQTVLTVGAVAMGVILVVFITAVIFGHHHKLTSVFTEAIPHITIQVAAVKPTPLQHVPGTRPGASSSRMEQQAPQRKYIDNWVQVADAVRRLANVRLVAPGVSDQAFASKGGHPVSVQVVGGDPALSDDVSPVTKHLLAGRYLDLRSEEIVIDTTLAADLQVATGDRLRLTSSTAASAVFTIVGIYSRGQGREPAYITLRAAQSLLGLGTAVNAIFVKVFDIYAADRVADQIMALWPYEAKSWSRELSEIFTMLRVESAVAYLVSILSLIASAFAMAAILIVSVLQKSKQIGILKSMGARRRQMLSVFILEGLGVGLVGSVVGAVLGIGLVWLLRLLKEPVTHVGRAPEPLFPVAVLPAYIALAMCTAIAASVLAAWLPARRAARLHPVEVMR